MMEMWTDSVLELWNPRRAQSVLGWPSYPSSAGAAHRRQGFRVGLLKASALLPNWQPVG